MSASVTTTVLDQQSRNGTFQSSSVAVPASDPATGVPYVFLFAGGAVTPADAQDAAKQCAIEIRATWDGTNYVTDPGWKLDWIGGAVDKHGNPQQPDLNISIPVDANGAQPQRVMLRLDTQGVLLNTGLTIGFGSV